MDIKLRNRPTMFMNSVRPKSALFKFKVWPQKRSQNLSSNSAQILLRNLPISGVLEGKMMWNLVGGRKWQFPTTFMKKTCSNSDGNNEISSREELAGYPPRPPAALLSILASRALVIQILWKFMGGKIRWLPPFSNLKFGHKREVRICPPIQPKYCLEIYPYLEF
jgi:hypothetical protein